MRVRCGGIGLSSQLLWSWAERSGVHSLSGLETKLKASLSTLLRPSQNKNGKEYKGCGNSLVKMQASLFLTCPAQFAYIHLQICVCIAHMACRG